jgi:hypothetical protein
VPLTSRSTPEVVQSPDYLEHRGQPCLANPYSQALVRPETKMSIKVHVTVKLDLIWVRKRGGVGTSGNLVQSLATALAV